MNIIREFLHLSELPHSLQLRLSDLRCRVCEHDGLPGGAGDRHLPHEADTMPSGSPAAASIQVHSVGLAFFNALQRILFGSQTIRSEDKNSFVICVRFHEALGVTSSGRCGFFFEERDPL